jgi:hypothetical protein
MERAWKVKRKLENNQLRKRDVVFLYYFVSPAVKEQFKKQAL